MPVTTRSNGPMDDTDKQVTTVAFVSGYHVNQSHSTKARSAVIAAEFKCQKLELEIKEVALKRALLEARRNVEIAKSKMALGPLETDKGKIASIQPSHRLISGDDFGTRLHSSYPSKLQLPPSHCVTTFNTQPFGRADSLQNGALDCNGEDGTASSSQSSLKRGDVDLSKIYDSSFASRLMLLPTPDPALGSSSPDGNEKASFQSSRPPLLKTPPLYPPTPLAAMFSGNEQQMNNGREKNNGPVDQSNQQVMVLREELDRKEAMASAWQAALQSYRAQLSGRHTKVAETQASEEDCMLQEDPRTSTELNNAQAQVPSLSSHEDTLQQQPSQKEDERIHTLIVNTDLQRKLADQMDLTDLRNQMLYSPYLLPFSGSLLVLSAGIGSQPRNHSYLKKFHSLEHNQRFGLRSAMDASNASDGSCFALVHSVGFGLKLSDLTGCLSVANVSVEERQIIRIQRRHAESIILHAIGLLYETLQRKDSPLLDTEWNPQIR